MIDNQTFWDALELIESLSNKLKEYANADNNANGNGAGCFIDPDAFIKDDIEKAEKFLNTEHSC